MILFWGDWAIKTSASEIDESLSLLSVCSASFKKKKYCFLLNQSEAWVIYST